MKPALASAVATAAPSIGPAIVTIAGYDVPVLALGLSIVALFLARLIAPPPLRKLTRQQQAALTALLMILLFLAVIGELPLIGNSEPMGAGMAVVTGAGLGFSGLLVVELLGKKFMAALRAFFGVTEDDQRP